MSRARYMMSKPMQIAMICLAFVSFLVSSSKAQYTPPPMITVQPLNVSVPVLGTAILSATSKRGTTYQWLLNGVPYSGGVVLNVPNILTGETVSSLTIVAGSSSAGSYSLKVSNNYGMVTSTPAALLLSNVITVVSNTVSFVAATTHKVATGFQISLSAPAGSNVVIQASADLANWSSLTTNTATSGSVTFIDTAALNMNARFYRARVQ